MCATEFSPGRQAMTESYVRLSTYSEGSVCVLMTIYIVHACNLADTALLDASHSIPARILRTAVWDSCD